MAMKNRKTGFKACLTKAALTGMAIVASSNWFTTPAFAEALQRDAERSSQSGTTEQASSTCQANQVVSQPIAIVIQDSSQYSEWLEGNYEPMLAYGDLNELGEASEIVLLVPEGQELSDAELATIEGEGWGRRFYYLIIPSIAGEVIETYLEKNTTPVYRSGSSSSEFGIRSIAREVCLDFTWGLGAAWGICDFFGDMIDQVVNRVQEYYQEQRRN